MPSSLPEAVPPKVLVGYQRAECPICGGSASIQVTWREQQGRYLLRCWSCRHGPTGPWLGDLARALDTNTDLLIRNPWDAGLIAARSNGAGRGTGAGPDGHGAPWGSFPSEWDIWQRNRELLINPRAFKARRWLARERQIDRATIKLCRVGWVSTGGRGYIVLPLYSNASTPRLVNVKARRVGKGQMRTWPGHGEHPLFPFVPKGRRVVLVAGELDALALLCRGIPAVSVTAGAGTFLDEYGSALRNKRVTVAFDAGEEAQAEVAASALRRARVFTWPSGTPRRYDPTRFLREGGDPASFFHHKPGA
jgi:hypothetical protein